MVKQEFNKINTLNKNRILSYILLIIGGTSLFFAQSSLWINNIIFNQHSFTSITNEVMLSESGRNAIAQSVVDKVFEDRPIADRIIGDRSVSFISNLLGSDISERAISKVSSVSYAYVTSDNRQDVAIDLSSIKQPIAGMISFSENRGREVNFDAAYIPDKVTLVKSDELPNFAKYIRVALLASFFLWLVVILSFGGYVIMNRENSVKRIYAVGAVIVIVSLLSLSTGPFVPPVVSSFVSNIQLRVVISDLTSAYLQPFINQTYLTLGITFIALLATRFRWIFISSWKASFDTINKKLVNK